MDPPTYEDAEGGEKASTWTFFSWSFPLLFMKSAVAGFYELTFTLNSANIIPSQGAFCFSSDRRRYTSMHTDKCSQLVESLLQTTALSSSDQPAGILFSFSFLIHLSAPKLLKLYYMLKEKQKTKSQNPWQVCNPNNWGKLQGRQQLSSREQLKVVVVASW